MNASTYLSNKSFFTLLIHSMIDNIKEFTTFFQKWSDLIKLMTNYH